MKINDNDKLELKEKSKFEKFIIEAFKQTKVIDIYESLEMAIEELPSYIEEIKIQNNKEKDQNYILNLNIVDKLSRIIERNYININIFISKILYILLSEENYDLLSNNSSVLINLSNVIMAILDEIKYTDNYFEVIQKSINFMQYLLDNSSKFLSKEQTKIISLLQNQLNSKLTSNAFLNFKNIYIDNILTLCKGETAGEKDKGIELLNSHFYELNSLREQFDILCLFGEDIIKAIFYESNPSLVNTYFKLSYFFISFLYNSLYKIKLSPYENDVSSQTDDNNIRKLNEQYYLLDSMEENIEFGENLYVTKYHGKEYRNMKILNQLIYELDADKDILLKHTSICNLAISIINCLISFDKSFKAQFVCFLILKRLYFIFPKYRNDLSDLIVNTLINMLSFDEKIINNIKDIFDSFLFYLLQKGDENTKNKLKEKLTEKKNEIQKDYLNYENINIFDKIDVQSDLIYISDFNLNIGCPINIEVNAGYEEERIIEIKSNYCLLYIGFNVPEYDINFHIIKYCPNINNSLKSNEKSEEKKQYQDHQYFYEIFKLEKSTGAKIILFVKNPSIYKIIFDNKYSWFNNKLIRYRCTIMNEYNNLGMSRLDSNENIKEDKKENMENINNNDDNKKEDKKEEKVGNENNVKIAVKFNNNINLPDINLDEDLNELDVEIK